MPRSNQLDEPPTAEVDPRPDPPLERVDLHEATIDEVAFSERYLVHMLLGRGGMGEVHLCRDQRMGREIAVKLTRPEKDARGDLRERFAREARVQGQLEHPAIVPVYDLGRRADGALFFTMKRVRGLTLRQIIDGLRRGDAELKRTYSRRKLLTAFISVCQAVHFANSRGVLHRDLKPANVMLGDFGEVYVLDWGLAKLIEDRQELAAEPVARRRARIDSSSAGGPHTLNGVVMGTPGYMAPEQLHGEVDKLDARTDVYALGALLYEILTLSRLHRTDHPAPLVSSTMHDLHAAPPALARAPELEMPPELEGVCLRATAHAPEDRQQSVRELFETVERFLDGDRDLERRRELAASAAQAAEAAAERALASADEPARREALEQAGRALALDPENAAAMRALLRLMVAPPVELPAEVQRDLARDQAEIARSASIDAGWTYGSCLLFAPGLLWMGVRDFRLLWLWIGLIAATSALGFLGPRLPGGHAWKHFVGFALVCSAILVSGPTAGPFVLAPVLACTSTIGFLLPVPPSFRVPTFLMGTLTLILPFVAEALGWVPRTTTFVADSIVIRSWTFHLPMVPTIVLFLAALVGSLLLTGIYALRMRDQLSAAQRHLHLQSWHLRQLLPSEARGAFEPTAPR